ncbi:uncharacterized protein KIAA0930 homolog [Clytia hemisphaerica]|uniref:Uncharacterized protein n=1 Tax=Clytia hemisphaerica TaxID=252671 RepID=A0A7M5UVU4_9CNID|eukprot:TCONS_00023685-protein
MEGLNNTLISEIEEILKNQDHSKKQDEDGFVMVAKEGVWPGLFGEFFMGVSVEENENCEAQDTSDDDMLFYVQNKPHSSDNEIKVYRKTSKNLPGLGDPHVNWEESVYLNLIMHGFEFTLTCAICVRLPSQDLKVLSKTVLTVHASHHMRRMDSKGESSDQSYPNIFFIIDSYDEVFESLSLQENEIVCVELTAKNKESGNESVIFLGSVKHEALVNVYDAKTSIGTKMAQKMSWMSAPNDHFEYIRMRGPHGKGYAEMRIGVMKSNLVEHNKINKNRRITEIKDLKETNERPDPPQRPPCNCFTNESIYNPTTAYPDSCPKCGQSATSNYGLPKIWSSTVKWFQKKPTAPILSPYLTYVTLPWSRIIKDVLQVKQTPLFSKDPRR